MTEAPPARILVRAPNWLGDCVMALPALAALKAAFPASRLDVAVGAAFSSCFAAAPFVDGVVPVPRQRGVGGALALWSHGRTCAHDPYAMGILLTNSFSSGVWMWATNTRRRIGYARDGRSLFLTDAVEVTPALAAAHQAEYYLHLVRCVGAEAPSVDSVLPALMVPETGVQAAAGVLSSLGVSSAYAVLAPTSAYGPVKDWPAERYAALAARIVNERGLPVCVCGTGRDGPICEQIALGAGEGVYSLAGQTDMDAFLGVLAGCALFCGGDSGGAHVAAACDKPSVVIFGITEPSRTRPLGRRVACVGQGGVVTPRLDDPAVRKAAREALEAISVQEVWDALCGVEEDA